jgi:hypothetical protein
VEAVPHEDEQSQQVRKKLAVEQYSTENDPIRLA